MGQTIIVCGVKAEIAEPELDAPALGFIGMFLDDVRRTSPCQSNDLA